MVRPQITWTENCLFCWLRLHPKIAETYGIKKCDGNTTIGSMLLQMLEAQGADVKWYERLAPEPTGTANEIAAAYIKTFARRPGQWLKQLSQRPEVAPPDHAAVLRRHGTPPIICAQQRAEKPVLLR